MTFYEGSPLAFVHRHQRIITPPDNPHPDNHAAGSWTLDVCDRHHKKPCEFVTKNLDERPEHIHHYCLPVDSTLSQGCVCCQQEDQWASLFHQINWMRAAAKAIRLQSEEAPGGVQGWARRAAQVAANILVDLADGLDDKYGDLLLEEAGSSKEDFQNKGEEKE